MFKGKSSFIHPGTILPAHRAGQFQRGPLPGNLFLSQALCDGLLPASGSSPWIQALAVRVHSSINKPRVAFRWMCGLRYIFPLVPGPDSWPSSLEHRGRNSTLLQDKGSP